MAVLHTEYSKKKGQQPSQVDKKILDYMGQGKEYYDDMLADIPNIQVWYQLSSLRTGLVSWYPFLEAAEVLEIGAGFGALTGMLCERCGHVVATERAVFRASAMAERWKEKDNLDIYAWNGQIWSLAGNLTILSWRGYWNVPVAGRQSVRGILHTCAKYQGF